MKMNFRTFPRAWRPHINIWLDRHAKWMTSLTTLQNLAIIIGVVVAIVHICMMNSIDKRRTAIEAVKSSRNFDFVCAYARLQTVAENVSPNDPKCATAMEGVYCQGNEKNNLGRLINDVTLIFVTYEHIWQLYDERLADHEIILNGVTRRVRAFSEIRDKLLAYVPFPLTNLHFEYLLQVAVKRDIKEKEKYKR